MARNNQQPVVRPQHTPPPPELIERFLHLQEKELELRTGELANTAQRDSYQKTIAEASIAANLQDRESERTHRTKNIKTFFLGAAVIVLLILVFMGYAIHAGKSDIVLKALEITATFAAGFLGGYGFKASRTKPPPPPTEQ